MKYLRFLFVISILASGIMTFARNGETGKRVEAYYFHFTQRCETCLAVEASAKENLEVLYPDLVKAGTITFQAINLNDKSSKPLAKKLKVPGQSLLLVQGDKQVNITNEAFLYARPNPDKFKALMKEKVDGLLK